MDKPNLRTHTRAARGSIWLAVALAAIAIVVGIALVHLIMLRSESTSYPPYSTYRTDPIGVRAYFEALVSMPELSVTRRLEPLVTLDDGHDTTLMLCGGTVTRKEPLPETEALEKFAASGGRLVVAFYPERERPGYWYPKEEKEKDDENKDQAEEADETPGSAEEPDSVDTEKDDDAKENDRDEPFKAKMVSLEERWGFMYAFDDLPQTTDKKMGTASATKQTNIDYLPDAAPWHSGLYFSDLAPEWTTVYSWDDHAVIIERAWENGSIVLCSDSYFVSNEAVRNDQVPGLLAWLTGPSTHIMFDETHLGIADQPNTMTLIRRYRLHLFLGVLILLGILFVWKNNSSLVPKRDIVIGAAPTTFGRGAASGLVNLLRRSIPQKGVIAACIEEWRRSFTLHPQQERIASAVSQEDRLDPVNAYQKLCAILAERKKP